MTLLVITVVNVLVNVLVICYVYFQQQESRLLKLRLTTVFYIYERHRKDLHLLTHS